MAKEKPISIEGVITEALPNAFFIVELDNGVSIRCTISGKIRTKYIKLYPGDRVKVEMSIYDMTQGRIVYRLK